MSQQVFFVDASVAGSDELKSALELSVGEGSKVFVLENNSDAFQQMDAALASLGDVQVDAVHIYAHGAAGSVTLGGKVVDQAALDESAAILDKIGSYLTEDADILLYSCNTAQGAAGQSFAQRLAALTRADVAASMDVTGSAGNWTLEYATGSVETASRDLPGYGGNLTAAPDTVAPTGWGSLVSADPANGTKVMGAATNDRLYNSDKTAANKQDTLMGGEGNDTYYISSTENYKAPVVFENANEGDDTLVSRVADFNLSDSDFDDVNTQGSKNTSIEHIVLESVEGMGTEQSFTGSAVDQTITGNALNNKLVGMGGADYLDGGDGDDSLDGGDGNLAAVGNSEADTMVGGKGNDTYIVRNANQVVTEKAKEGTDDVYSFIDYTLGANVENLTLLTGAVSGTGNADANVLKGNVVSNYLSGLAGNDTLHGGKTTLGAGTVTYKNAFGEDTDKAAVAPLEINRDIDTLDGGAGNDTYYVYREVLRDKATNAIAQGDVIVDAAGKDTIISTVNYNLQDAAQVEELQLVGSAVQGTGNSLNNRIVGNETLGSTLDGTAGSNTLVGGYGNDVFRMRSTGDKIEDLGGNNDVVESWVTVNLASSKAAIENIELQEVIDPVVLAKNKNANNINATAGKSVATKLVGNAGNNQLTGGDMNDTLYGGAFGKDTLTGGKGNDLYVVTSADVTVKEAANAGEADSVLASVDYALGAKSNVEKLYLAKGAATGTGNEMANVIAVVGDATEGIKTTTMATLNTALGTIGLDTIDGATTKVVLDGGKNTAGLAGDTLVGAAAGNTQFYTYNANDSIEAQGNNNVIYISYDVTASVNGKDAAAAETADWLAYFNARGVDLSAAGVTFVYRGNPEGKVTEAGRTIEGTTTSTYLVGTNRKDVITAESATATTIDGGTGADTMTGSTAADTFYVDDVKDVVAGKGGADKVHSTVSVDLGARQTAFIKDGGAALMKAANNGITNTDTVDVYLDGTKAISAAGFADKTNRLYGNSAANTLIGGNEGNTLNGGAGADVMVGGTKEDHFYIDNKGDKVVNGGGNDVIHTSGVAVDLTSANHGAGAVTKVAIEEAASVTGFYKAATKTAAAQTKDESITGSAGDDTIDGKGGADTVIAGAGNDLVYYHGTEAKVLGGNDGAVAGSDTLVVASDVTGVTTLGYAANGGDGSAAKLLGSFDAVKLEKGAKVNVDFTGATTAVTITGNEQDTSLTGGTGNDYIATGGGKDTVNAGAGDDTIELVTSASKTAYSAGEVNGGDGEDTLILGSGADKVVLSDGATTGVIVINTATAIKDVDTKVTAASIEEFNGGAGNDVIDATATRHGVTLSGGAGANTLYGGAGSDTFVLRDGTDTIYTDGNPKGEGYDNSIVAHDVIKLTLDAVGKTFTVKDFNAGLDAVDCDALTELGWDTVPASTQSGSTATLVWTNPTNSKEKITVKFENTTAADIKFESTAELTENESYLNEQAKQKARLTGQGLVLTGSKYGDNFSVVSSATQDSEANKVYGNGGDDVLTGGGDYDKLYGGSGNDSLVGNGTLYGDEVDVKTVKADKTVNETVDATAGNDTLVATALTGTSKLITGNGDNVVRIEGVAAGQSAKTAIITGGTGTDALVLGSAAALDLTANTLKMGDNTIMVNMTYIDKFEGSADNDTITAAASALYYTTNGGADSVTGGADDDIVVVTTLVDGTSIDLKAGTNNIVIEDVTPGPAEGGAVTLNADGGTLSLKFANAVKLDLEDATIEMGSNKLGGVTIQASTLHLNGSEGADAITAKQGTALDYETHGGADTVTGSNVNDTIMVHTLLNGVSINGNGGADLITVGKLDTAKNAAATIKTVVVDEQHPENDKLHLDFSALRVAGSDGMTEAQIIAATAEYDLTLNIKKGASSVALGKNKATDYASVKLNDLSGVTTFTGANNVRKNYFYVDSLTAGMALIGGDRTGIENTFHVADFEDDAGIDPDKAAVTITGTDQDNDALAFRTAASGKSIDLDFNANTVSLGTRGTDGELKADSKKMSLTNVTKIDEYRGTAAADKVTGIAGKALHYSTHAGADTVIGQNAEDEIHVSELVAGVQVTTPGAITVGATKAISPGQAMDSEGHALTKLQGSTLKFEDATTLAKQSDSGVYHITIGNGGKSHVVLSDFTEYVGSDMADDFTMELTDGVTYYMGGTSKAADGEQDILRFKGVAADIDGATLCGGTQSDPTTGTAKLSFTGLSDAASLAFTLGSTSSSVTVEEGLSTVTATELDISGFTTFEGHKGVDTFSIASLGDGWKLDGGDGGTDVFEIKALADNGISATVKSGALKDSENVPNNGTLSFAGANAVELTLGTNTAKVKIDDKTADLTLTNIREFRGSSTKATTFNVGTLASADYVLNGGTDTDTVSFADKTVEKATDLGVTATLSGGVLTAGNVKLHVDSNINKFVGTGGKDTFTVDLLGGRDFGGGTGGADVFNVTAVSDGQSAEVTSGGAGGTLSFAGLTQDITESDKTWSLSKADFALAANAVQVTATSSLAEESDKTRTVSVTIGNIDTLEGASGVANTFNVSGLSGETREITLTGGSKNDTVSFAKDDAAAITAILEDGKLKVDNLQLNLNSIETIIGTKETDTFKLGTLSQGMTVDGGTADATDSFEVTTVAKDVSATLKSGAADGSLTLGGTDAHTLTVTTAETVTAAFGEGKGTLTLQNISAITDSSNKDSTFDLISAGTAIKTVTGGEGSDSYKLNITGGAAVTDTDRSKADTIQLFGFAENAAAEVLAGGLDGNTYTFTTLKFNYTNEGVLTVKNGDHTLLSFSIGTDAATDAEHDVLKLMDHAGTGSLFAGLDEASGLRDCAGFDLSGFTGSTAMADKTAFTYDSETKLLSLKTA